MTSSHQLGIEAEADLLRGASACSPRQRAEGLACPHSLILFKWQAKVCGRFWRDRELWRHCQAAVACGTMWVAAYGHTATTAICLLPLKWLPHPFCLLLCTLPFKKGSIFTLMAFTESTLHRQAVSVLACLRLNTSGSEFFPGWLCTMEMQFTRLNCEHSCASLCSRLKNL